MRYACIFGASCPNVAKGYLDAAFAAGALLAERGLGMVFGGGNTGLMGAAARGVKSAGGRLIGVIPEKLNQPGIAYPHCDQLIVTPDMHTRKAKMEALSFGFLALPGGFGTLEELLEVITLNQLGYLQAPVVLLNTAITTSCWPSWIPALPRTLPRPPAGGSTRRPPPQPLRWKPYAPPGRPSCLTR